MNRMAASVFGQIHPLPVQQLDGSCLRDPLRRASVRAVRSSTLQRCCKGLRSGETRGDIRTKGLCGEPSWSAGQSFHEQPFLGRVAKTIGSRSSPQRLSPCRGLSDQLRAKYAAPTFLKPQAPEPDSGGALPKIVGIDYGTKKTGVAVKYGTGLYRTLKVFDTPSSSLDFAARLVRCAVVEGAAGFVVGLPQQEERSTGKANGWARICHNFALTLALVAQKEQLHVYLYDERMTTYSARVQAGLFNYTGSKAKKSKLRKKEEQLDAMAALVLLQHYDERPDLAQLVVPERPGAAAGNNSGTNMSGAGTTATATAAERAGEDTNTSDGAESTTDGPSTTVLIS